MNIEFLVIAGGWLVMIVALIKFIPKSKLREAQVAFLAKQIITWLFGLLVAEFRLIEYPYRLFAYANKASFSFEYFIYPSFCALFNVNYPEKKSKFSKFMYYFYYTTGITIIEVLAEKYTNVINYIHWHWWISWITLFLTFYIVRKYYEWFFRLKQKN